MTHILLGLMLVQTPQIGASLSDTVQLVYESGGIRQAPWIYESVRVIGDVAYDRCVAVARRAQTERESCVRGDTLFERNAVGTRVPVRPVGANMRLEVATPAGNLVEYTTGDFATRSVAGATDISVIATTIVTRDSSGTILRRLREDYAPSLLTAVWGIFEVPDGMGGWRTDREFSLHKVQYVRSDIEIPAYTAVLVLTARVSQTICGMMECIRAEYASARSRDRSTRSSSEGGLGAQLPARCANGHPAAEAAPE